MKPYITYDSEADILAIYLTDKEPVDAIDYAEGVTMAVDAERRPVYLEVLDARERVDNSALLDEVAEPVEVDTR